MFKSCKNYSLIFRQTRGFSLVELLTSLGIVGSLSVIGIKTYQSQTDKSRTAEAKYSLSYIYSSEKNFKSIWGAYHENLAVVGAVPDGAYYYDIGFKDSSTLSTSDGNLGSYPSSGTLTVKECSNFYQICNGDCVSNAPRVGTNTYFFYAGAGAGSFNCDITGGLYVKDHSATGDGAGENSFEALARSRLKNEDLWSINQDKTFNHIKDGTN